MSIRVELADVLTRYRSDAATLRRTGHEADAALLERIADEVAVTADDWITFISEVDAMGRSGRSADWLRGRFPEWERDGHAKLVNRERKYRRAIIPRKYNLSDARAAGAEAARKQRKAKKSA